MNLMTLDSARQLLADRVVPLDPVEMGLADARGCRLAESVRADIDMPGTDVSVMDGYAMRWDDLAAGALPVAFEIPAGHMPGELPHGAAARIFTGAALPKGADTVIPQEQAETQADGRVKFQPTECGSYIRRKGELCSAGAVVASPGDLLTPQFVAMLGAVGAASVRVIPRPRVAVLSTGSELVPIDQLPGPGKIRDSNGVMLAALARTAGFQVTFATHVADDRDALRQAFTQAIDSADLVVSSGGVSVGDHDLVPEILAELNAETLFHKLSIKPGKPALVARFTGAWFVGLPGNPVSALVGWRMFARAVGKTLAGDSEALREVPEKAVLADSTQNTGRRTLLTPALLTTSRQGAQVTPLKWKGSHDIVAAARANALAILDIGAKLEPGAVIDCFRLDGGAQPDHKGDRT